MRLWYLVVVFVGFESLTLFTTAKPWSVKKGDLINSKKELLLSAEPSNLYNLPKYGKRLATQDAHKNDFAHSIHETNDNPSEEKRTTLIKTKLDQIRHRQREIEKERERERMLNVNGQMKKERERERMREREEERKKLGPDGKVIIALQKEGERERQRLGPNGMIQQQRQRFRYREEGQDQKMDISPKQAL